jgi:hypothetical protein
MPDFDAPAFLKRLQSRRNFLRQGGRLLLAVPLFGFAGIPSCSSGSGTSSTPPNNGYTGTDDQLLDDIESAAFQFFWNQANPTTGFIKDRANATGSDTYTDSSIASIGFGLTALCIADSRGYATSAALQSRALLTLQSLQTLAAGHQGFFYHFLDWGTGARYNQCELSSIDTAILMCGVLSVRQHFSSNAAIVTAANQLYQAVNWQWMLNGGQTLSMGWTPESGFITTHWDHYCELMMMYLLGIGSSTYPLPASTWQAWSRPTYTYQGITYISAGDPLFVHQYSHAWIDFRNQHDSYADYFQNSVYATQAHKLFCLSLEAQFSDYGTNFWGITASDSRNGYVAWGGPPALGPLDGTVVPCAAAGSVPFVSADCIAVLRNLRGYYPNAWGRYGFTDALNPLYNWYNPDVLGIDQGISMLMAENYRSGFVWSNFMTNPEIKNAMTLAGFLPNT